MKSENLLNVKNMPNRISQSGLRWLWVTVVVIILDYTTKYYAQKYLPFLTPVPLFPGFNLTLSYNTGAAFSFLDNAPGWQVWFFGGIASVVSLGIVLWLKRLMWREYGLCIALSLIVGGALGNLLDRIYYGHVIDFIQWYIADYYWPTFNIADSAICVGAVLLFLNALFKK